MNNFMKSVALGALLTHGPIAFAQDWHANFPSGNPITSTEWLGCDGTSTQPLRIKTVPDYAIDLYTSDIRRFTLLPDNTYATLGAYSGLVADGYSLHSPDVAAFYTGGAPGPFSLDHLAAATNSSYQDAFRDWAKTGTTYTGGGTMGYFGLKEYGKTNTDLVMQLAKREGETAPDRIRFLFTDVLNGSSATGADSQEGLEGMRLTAVGNDEVNVGIGDFFAAGVGEPAERLDVVDGKVRIRQLPTDAVSTSNEYVTVNTTTGVLEHRPLPPSATPGCEWTRLIGAQRVQSGMAPAVPGSTCPDRAWLYDIGGIGSSFKLAVVHNALDRAVDGGLSVSVTTNGGASTIRGLKCEVTPQSPSTTTSDGYGADFSVVGPGIHGTGTRATVYANRAGVSLSTAYGHRGRVEISEGTVSQSFGTNGETRMINGASASYAYGALGHANIETVTTVIGSLGIDGYSQVRGGGAIAEAYGVRGRAVVTAPSVVNNNFGTHGHARNGVNNYSIFGQNATGGTVNWSGFFAGPISASGTSFPSDENLKEGIIDLESPMDILNRLHPKSYTYRRDAFPQMGLPEGTRYGFIAQEVREEFPQFVTNSYQPSSIDSLGNELSPAVEYLALSTSDIIPVLVGAVQQYDQIQNSHIEELNSLRAVLQEQRARLDQLEQALAACCSNPDGSRSQAPTNTTEPALDDRGDDRKLRIVPNPFNESTTVYYTLERGGRTQLIANSADGRELRVLQEANLVAGDYQFQWNTASLAPGMYYITLLLDGQPVVKKGVKVAR